MLTTTRVEPGQVAMTEAHGKYRGLNPVNGEYCRGDPLQRLHQTSHRKGRVEARFSLYSLV